MPDEFSYPEPDPNKKSAADLWNGRYGQANGFLFGREPIVSLKTYASVLRKGKVLDVAMGEGRNAVFLAQQGFVVEGVDCSTVAIERAKSLAAEKGVAVDAKTQNLDFFLMPLMKYDSVILSYYKPQPRFFSEIRRGLVAGGTFVLEAYLVDHVRENPNAGIEVAECYRPNEVLGLLRDFQVVLYREIPDGKTHTVQVIARKVAA